MPRPLRSIETLRTAFPEGVFTADDARGVGVSGSTADRLVARDLLLRAGVRKYLVPPAPTTSRDRYLAGLRRLLDAHPGAVAAGVSAAAARGLRCPDPWGDWLNLPFVLGTERPIHRRPGLRVVRLVEGEVLDGLRCTDLPVTAREVARHLPAPQALIVLDHVAREIAGTDDKLRLIAPKTRAKVAAALGTGAAVPRERAARRTMSWADPAADSAPESYLRGHLLLAGVEAPRVNHPVTAASGRGYFPDLWWPDRSLAIEIDGKEKYDGPGALYAEKIREDDLRLAGLQVLRWTAGDVFRFAPALVAQLR
jgi:hypothetical protein